MSEPLPGPVARFNASVRNGQPGEILLVLGGALDGQHIARCGRGRVHTSLVEYDDGVVRETYVIAQHHDRTVFKFRDAVAAEPVVSEPVIRMTREERARRVAKAAQGLAIEDVGYSLSTVRELREQLLEAESIIASLEVEVDRLAR